ncbi:hypothetical protein [Deinococcus altitudinis]|uniref:hypothetical protein n=1 Tax=Deinococcus altitudinis TaxID=468914 RepID=UPI0038917E50
MIDLIPSGQQRLHLLLSGGLIMPSWLRTTLGVLLVLAGFVWFLQGISVLPGTFMRGSTLWTVIGAVVAIGGLSLLGVFRNRTGK